MEPGTPVGASIASLALYLRYPHALSDARLSALFRQVCGVSISAGALATLCQRVNTRLDDRVAEILTRLRSSRLVCREETGARVTGRTPGEWVFQNAAVCVPVIRPRRGTGSSKQSWATIAQPSGSPISTVPKSTTRPSTGRSVWPINDGIVILPARQVIRCLPHA
jgi:hypothetical protein